MKQICTCARAHPLWYLNNRWTFCSEIRCVVRHECVLLYACYAGQCWGISPHENTCSCTPTQANIFAPACLSSKMHLTGSIPCISSLLLIYQVSHSFRFHWHWSTSGCIRNSSQDGTKENIIWRPKVNLVYQRNLVREFEHYILQIHESLSGLHFSVQEGN